jgi:hypothetical protein
MNDRLARGAIGCFVIAWCVLILVVVALAVG